MRLIKIYTCIDIFTSIKCQNGYVNINIFLSLRSIENFRHSYSYTKKKMSHYLHYSEKHRIMGIFLYAIDSK